MYIKCVEECKAHKYDDGKEKEQQRGYLYT